MPPDARLGTPTDNALYYGDCLDWMREWPAECVDLIYLDPPFNSQQNYNMLFATEGGGDAQYRAFADTWVWDTPAAERLDDYLGAVAKPAHRAIDGLHRMLGECGMLAYLTYMAERLEECRRLLKPTGSIYLHCDPTASHSLKLLMDSIFGVLNFRNEVHWYYYNKMHDRRKKLFANATDSLLFYVKDHRSEFSFTQLRERRDKPVRQLARKKVKGKLVNVKDEAGKVVYNIRTHRTIDNVWRIPGLQPASRERLGYPTQKPVALLERIVKASSNPDDLVLDPFCGCGTTVAAADALGRRWIGIDIDSHAIEVMLQRLGDRTIPTYGIPADYRSAKLLARNNAFGFETWAIQRAPGFAPNTRQVGDGGIDGRGTLTVKPDDWQSRLAIAQVKGGKKPPVDGLRAFCNVTDQRKAAVGCYITLDPISSPKARADAWLGNIHVSGIKYDRMNLWSIADYFDKRRPPLPPMNNPYTGKPLAQGALF